MSDDALLKRFDDLIKDESLDAAIVLREYLRPAHGLRGNFFPPTFAGTGSDRRGGYHIDWKGGAPNAHDPEQAAADGRLANRCTVDSVPSQANRMEARLKRYVGTSIPQVTLTGSRQGVDLDLLDVGHRVADAALRFSRKSETEDDYRPFREAMEAYVAGDAEPLAKLAPTSLVFGHWDSRPGGSKSKARRLVRGEIVAFNVQPVTRRSQYWSSIDPEVSQELGQRLKEAKEAAKEDDTKNVASQLGMTDVPAPETHGGVIAFGDIERTAIIALSGLRALAAVPVGEGGRRNLDAARTLALRRYLLGVCFAAVAEAGAWDLREGCILVRHKDRKDGAFKGVKVSFAGDGPPWTHPSETECRDFLSVAAKAFFGETGVPKEVTVTFDPGRAASALAKDEMPKGKDELVAALAARPEFAGKDAELKKKKAPDLKKLWLVAAIMERAEYADKEAELSAKKTKDLEALWRAGAQATPEE